MANQPPPCPWPAAHWHTDPGEVPAHWRLALMEAFFEHPQLRDAIDALLGGLEAAYEEKGDEE